VLAIERRAGHEVFNVADSLTGTVDELLTSVQLAFGLKPRIWHVPAAAAWRAAAAVEQLHRSMVLSRAPLLTRFLVAQLAFDFTLDIQRAIDVLGYRPTRSYPEAFSELASEKRLDLQNSARPASTSALRARVLLQVDVHEQVTHRRAKGGGYQSRTGTIPPVASPYAQTSMSP
jgi:hypothetical protein